MQFRKLIAEERWEEAIHILEAVPEDFPFIERLHLTDVHGIKRVEIPALDVGIGESFAHREWYQNVSRNWEPYISPVFERRAPPRRNIFAVAVPVKDQQDKPLAILVMHTDLGAFFDWARNIEIGPGGFLYIVDSKGQLAFHPKYPAQGEIIDYKEVPVVQLVLQGKTNVEITYNPVEKEKRVSAYVPAKYGWGVIAQQPVTTAFAFKNRQMQHILFGYGLILLFSVLVIVLAAQIFRQRRKVDEDHRVMNELEFRVAKRTHELEAVNRELESFSYSVSHDLRSPLRAIEGFTQIMVEDYGPQLDAEGNRLLLVIRDNARRMSMLIDDLLAFSRLGRQAMKAVDINMKQLVENVIHELQAQNTSQDMNFIIHPLPEARGDRTLIQQVWVNLISNAIKYSGSQPQSRIEVGSYTKDMEIVYYVKDNGTGFNMEYYDKLFMVFQRLHRTEDFPGTGIGLAIVQRVIARHGGRVWAESVVNAGATFYFSLPVIPGP